ncbi:hypothetical protein JIN85_07815 [Luteolibacter pohnpeiensis]|uniref:Uncharacterized protein n=1 Tax=Luteolibacter pohnpeiensis TaxID=454153 RepID=A0A934S7N9_9BACT|nr:hypothetical protein [Luteolibacter pohnpeiensis]MBK1882316.1 hypothetical protein [Luteolibacter pohnpeiensis]
MFDFIFDHPQLLILIGGGTIFLFNKYRELKESQEANEEIEEINRREREAAGESAEYEYRFPPANEVPDTPPPLPYVPPPLKTSNKTVVRGKTRMPEPPPLPSKMGVDRTELERQQQLQAKLREIRKSKPVSLPMARTTKTVAVTSTVSAKDSVRSRLRNKSELRRAIIMREILDPPVGLR